MPENLYPQLLTAPLMNQKVSTLRGSESTAKILRILRKNILKSNGNIRMPTIDYYMHPQVQVLLLWLVAFQLSECQSLLWDCL